MELFDYLMAKKGHNTGRDLFSYLLGKKASGGSGTYTTFSGITLNISNTVFGKIKNFMLNSTELTQDGTPSPDNPVDVNVIKGENNVKVENKNLAPSNWGENFVSRINDSSLASITTQDNRNCVTYTASAGYGDYDNKYLFKTNWKENTQYTISYFAYSSTGYLNLAIEYTDGTNTSMDGTPITNWAKITLTSTANKTIKYIRGRYTGGNTYIDIDTFQVEEGIIATEYVEHQEQNYPIDLEDLEYCKIRDYADQIFKNTTDSEFYDNTLIENEWYLKKNIGEIVLNGSESGWTNVGGNAPYKYTNSNIKMSSSESDTNLLSNYYPCKKWSDSWSSFDYMVVQTRNGQSIQFRNVDISTLEEFKVWLSSHNTIVYYPLATPTYIHISQEDYPTLKAQLEKLYNNAKSYNGQTNITQTNDDLPFNISVDVLIKDEE